ncbi:MAG: hypothetical protein KME19_20920 [Microcoleus vaginatus WJT46-NPBG5]|nr:hypothetical protein [Microcoleus vaginatus WJT46-NPBG5]
MPMKPDLNPAGAVGIGVISEIFRISFLVRDRLQCHFMLTAGKATESFAKTLNA